MAIQIATWNINGIRARKDSMVSWIKKNTPHIICLQEVKASVDQIPSEIDVLSDEYFFYWNGSTVRKGYSGTGILLRKELPVLLKKGAEVIIPPFDFENRVVELLFESLSMICIYAPRGEKEDHYRVKLDFFSNLKNYVSSRLQQNLHVIVAGDINVAHQDIDVHYSQVDHTMVGLRPPERESIDNLLSVGLDDVFRKIYPDARDVFTWWPYWRHARERNLGWRIDCFYVSSGIASLVKDVRVDKEEKSSDHAPVIASLDPL